MSDNCLTVQSTGIRPPYTVKSVEKLKSIVEEVEDNTGTTKSNPSYMEEIITDGALVDLFEKACESPAQNIDKVNLIEN